MIDLRKRSGECAKDILEVVAFKQGMKFKNALLLSTNWQSHIVNDLAEVWFEGEKYPNITYAITSPSVDLVPLACDELIENVIEAVRGKKVSVRKGIEIEYDEESKTFLIDLRIAVLE